MAPAALRPVPSAPVVALALAIALAPALVAASVPRTVTATFVTGEGELYAPSGLWPKDDQHVVSVNDVEVAVPGQGPYPGPTCPDANHIGGACFALDGTETHVTARIFDSVVVTSPIAADLQVINATGVVVNSIAFCTTPIRPLDVPAGSVTVAVLLYDPALAALVCPRPATPTTGTITVTFT